MIAPLPRLLVLTDRAQLPRGRDLITTVAACAEAGLATVVLRELDLPEPQRADLAGRLSPHVGVISARTRLPAACGIHLSAAQSEPDTAGAPQLIGRSCHDVAEVEQAARHGADYVTLSPVAASASKPGYGPALGDADLRDAVVAAGKTRLFALGGVDERNAGFLRESGAHGVAVMGAVMRAEEPARVVARLLAVVA